MSTATKSNPLATESSAASPVDNGVKVAEARATIEDRTREAAAVVQRDQEERQKKLDDERELKQAYDTLANHRRLMEASDPQVNTGNKLTQRHALYAAGVALLPTPLDILAIGGVEIKLLADLAGQYGVPFSKSSGKAVIGTLAASVGTSTLATGGIYSIIKIIPIVGQAAGMLALPVVAYASTYALGKVFGAHFASGGTLLNFDPLEQKAAYQTHLKHGTELARGLVRG